MSVNKLLQEAERWYQQAVDNLEAASALSAAKKYAQTCFYSQQAGEKALKAVWYFLDLDPWGHSCARLIQKLPEDEQARFSTVMETALALDKLYIPTRYPDALAEPTPAEAFTKREGETAMSASQEILQCVEKRIYSR
ncbi:MAG: HEPN domain-containing protein [Cyanobacteria bacterium J06598_3]